MQTDLPKQIKFIFNIEPPNTYGTKEKKFKHLR